MAWIWLAKVWISKVWIKEHGDLNGAHYRQSFKYYLNVDKTLLSFDLNIPQKWILIKVGIERRSALVILLPEKDAET